MIARSAPYPRSRIALQPHRYRPDSSPIVCAVVTVPLSLTPASCRIIAAIAWAMLGPFISAAPRPQILLSRTSPENGSPFQAAAISAFTGTTSEWASHVNDRPPPVPLRVATTFGRLD